MIGHSPMDTQQHFQMEKTFDTMKECKEHLLEQKPDGRFEVMNEFVVDMQFKWDWLVAGCKNDETGEKFLVLPDYPKGKPKELEGFVLDLDQFDI